MKEVLDILRFLLAIIIVLMELAVFTYFIWSSILYDYCRKPFKEAHTIPLRVTRDFIRNLKWIKKQSSL